MLNNVLQTYFMNDGAPPYYSDKVKELSPYSMPTTFTSIESLWSFHLVKSERECVLCKKWRGETEREFGTLFKVKVSGDNELI